jgi:hypothetical protein
MKKEMRDKLLDVIHVMTDKTVRKSLDQTGYMIDWDAVLRSIKGVAEWNPSKDLVKPLVKPKPSRFDAPVLKDAPKPVTEIRDMLNTLIRDVTESEARAVTGFRLNRVLAIVEQIVMMLENLAKPGWRPTIFPTIQPLKCTPIFPTIQPVVPSPYPPGGGIVYQAANEQEPSSQADGSAE